MLIKNTLRSFSKTKTTLISLVFLAFLSTGFYTLLTDVNNSLQTSYNNIVKKGNLHDVIVTEKYDYGNLGDIVEETNSTKQVYFPIWNDSLEYKIENISINSKDSLLNIQDWSWVINEGGKLNSTVNSKYTFAYKIFLNKDPFNFFKESTEKKFVDFLDEFSFKYQIVGCYNSSLPTKNLISNSRNLFFDFNYRADEKSNRKNNVKYKIKLFLDDFFKQNPNSFDAYNKHYCYRYDKSKNINTLTPIVEYVCVDQTNEQDFIREKYLKYLNPVIYTKPSTSIDGISENDQLIQQKEKNTSILTELIKFDKNSTISGFLTDNNFDYRRHEAFNFTDKDSPTKIVKVSCNDTVSNLVLEKGFLLSDERINEFSKYIDLYNKIISGEILICPTEQGWETSVGKDNIELFTRFIRDLYEANKNDDNKRTLVESLDYLIKLDENGRKEFGNRLNGRFSASKIRTYKDFLCHMFKNKYGSNGNVKVEKIDNKLVFTSTRNMIPMNLELYDFSSYEMVVSSGTFKFSNKKIIDGNYREEWNKIKSGFYSLSDISNFINKLPDEYTVRIADTKFVIIGSGTTPDFMYPIYDENLLIPNPKNEKIYFLNKNGYEMIWSSYRSSPIENALFCKYSSPIGINFSSEILSVNDMNKWCKKYMSWPDNIVPVCLADDTSNLLNPMPAARIVFVSNLVSTIETVTYVIVIIILFVSLYVAIVVIKNYIIKNKQIFSILTANGVNKWKIILSILPFCLIPGVVGAVYGYIQGFLLQTVGVNLFNDYWYHSVEFANFNFISLCVCLFIAMVPFFSVSLLISYLVLSDDLVSSIKNDPVFPVTKFSLLAKKLFKRYPIFTRFRVSIAFNSLNKFLNLSIMSISAFSIFSFAVANNGKFEIAQKETFDAQNFKYSIDLVTPTEQGGLIKYTDFYSLGRTIDDQYDTSESACFNSDKYLFKEPNVLLNKWANLHFATFYDDGNQKNDILFLKDKVQSKITLNYSLGLSMIGITNPWKISESMMPENQKIASNNQTQKLLKFLYENYCSPNSGYNDQKNCQEFIKEIIADNGNISYQLQIGNIGNVIGPKPSYVKMLTDAFEKISLKQNIDDDKNNSLLYDYKISYNTIGLPEQTIGQKKFFDDKIKQGSSPKYSYTKINAKELITSNNDEISIIGIKNNEINDKNYLGPILKNQNGKILNDDLFTTYSIDGVYNVIINQVIANKYNLSVGDVFEAKIINSYKRFTSNYDQKLVKFKVIGLTSSARGEEIYIAYDKANAILDFPEEDLKRAFNGFFTNDLISYTGETSLYSFSGLFPGISYFNPNIEYLRNAIFLTCSTEMVNELKDTFVHAKPPNSVSVKLEKYNPENRVKLNKIALANALKCPPMNNEEKINWLNKKYGDIKNVNDVRITKIIDDLHETYGSPYVSLISYITNIENSKSIFSSISNLSSTITDISVGLISIIVFLIVVLISSMLISDAKKIIVRMKALGFNNLKIVSSFLAIYVPVIFISLAFSIPIVWLLLSIYKDVIFNSSQIVLPIVSSWVNILCGLLALSILFGISFIIGWISTKRINLAKEIKSS